MNKALLHAKIMEVIDQMHDAGIELPEMLKRRDKREPARLEKERLEDKIFIRIRKHFKKQAAAIQARIETYYPSRKDIVPLPTIPTDDLFEPDDETVADLIKLITAGGTAGIQQFASKIGVQLDYTLTNQQAADWARKYAYDLVRGIDDTTRVTLQKAISGFIETPGLTIRDVMDMLPYSEERARMIAVTETTRAYSKGQQLGSDQLAKEFPDVKVVNHWFTNQDDKVCELCGPLGEEPLNEVEGDATFYEPDGDNDGFPPRHVNCRCWTDYTTRIDG